MDMTGTIPASHGTQTDHLGDLLLAPDRVAGQRCIVDGLGSGENS
jgi:hypothetical protein